MERTNSFYNSTHSYQNIVNLFFETIERENEAISHLGHYRIVNSRNMLTHNVSLCAHNSSPTVHLTFYLFCMCAFFCSYSSFGDFNYFCIKRNLSELTELRARYSLLKARSTMLGNKVESTTFLFVFIYSGTIIAVEDGRLQIGFIGGTESRLQQEDRLAYRNYTHYGESDIGGSRLLSVNRRISLPPSIFVTRPNEHNRKAT